MRPSCKANGRKGRSRCNLEHWAPLCQNAFLCLGECGGNPKRMSQSNAASFLQSTERRLCQIKPSGLTGRAWGIGQLSRHQSFRVEVCAYAKERVGHLLWRRPRDSRSPALCGYGLRGRIPARPARYATHPVLLHRVAVLLHASFRGHLAVAPLRFASPSPPPGWTGDFHPQAA